MNDEMSDSPHVLIVEGRFYEDIAEDLANGAGAVLEDAGISYNRISVPGAFEVPAAIRFAICSMEGHAAPVHYSGYIALGCIIRGETSHFEYICNATSRALMDLTFNDSIALGFGILTCDDRKQAWARAAVNQKNKGAEAAATCLRMMELKKTLRLVQQ